VNIVANGDPCLERASHCKMGAGPRCPFAFIFLANNPIVILPS
jgi:hypothetical protein